MMFQGIMMDHYICYNMLPSKSKGLKRRGPCRGDPKSQFRRVIPTMPRIHTPRHRISMTMEFWKSSLSISLGFLWLPSWLLRSLGLLLGSPSWLSGSYIASTLDFSRFVSVSFFCMLKLWCWLVIPFRVRDPKSTGWWMMPRMAF